jgi:UDP-N-acetylglucosamine 2-epimerase (non-hydrolysing)
MRIHLIAAARPNFMKIAPLYHALVKESWAEVVIVHTGQHYDLNMSDVFFQDLDLPEPHIHLGVGSGTHAEQTGQVMIAYEKVLNEKHPDLVIVVGDVNSTVACTLAAVKVTHPIQIDKIVHSNVKSNHINSPQPPAHSSKLTAHSNIKKPMSLINDGFEIDGKAKSSTSINNDALSAMSDELDGRRPVVAHLEAGLRSFDRSMPEEINRLVTDALADILWTPSPDGDKNLIKEGVAEEKIERVGNIMIDSLEMLRDTIETQSTCRELGLTPGKFGLVTLHRPSNVDDPQALQQLCNALTQISQKTPLFFPVHPRTRKNIESSGLMPFMENSNRLILSEPINYVRFMNLVFNCRFALTDSGGIQEETTYLGIPCITLRPNTERPITITEGTNRLCTLDNLEGTIADVLSQKISEKPQIEMWDGKTAERVVQSIKSRFGY